MSYQMHHTGLAVLEARWWEHGNDSVRPLFETIAGIIEENPHSVRYDMFCDEDSLAENVKDICQKGDYHSIYISSHGYENSILGLGDHEISRTIIRNIFRNYNLVGTISGLYFGSCLIATERNAEFWLSEASKTNLQWVAGYNKTVDWIDSSGIDMIFWSKYLYKKRKNRSKTKNKKTDIQILKFTADEIKNLIPTIFNKMGFNVYHLDDSGSLVSIW